MPSHTQRTPGDNRQDEHHQQGGVLHSSAQAPKKAQKYDTADLQHRHKKKERQAFRDTLGNDTDQQIEAAVSKRCPRQRRQGNVNDSVKPRSRDGKQNDNHYQKPDVIQ
jgi:hypothetical protein